MSDNISFISEYITSIPDVFNHDILFEDKIDFLIKQNYPEEAVNFAKDIRDDYKNRYNKWLVWTANQIKDEPGLTKEPRETWISILDWMNDKKPDAMKYDFSMAKQESNKWHDELAKTSEKEPRHGYKSKNIEYELPGGYFIVKLESGDCRSEGEKMGHCVAGYADRVADGDTDIYSLRDKNNEPHVTIEIGEDGLIKQVQGKRNEPPIDKYMKMVREWLKKSGYEDEQMKSAITAYQYARNIIKGRWPEGEEAIAYGDDHNTAWAYAVNIIRGRWPEGEEEIKKNAITAYQYARDIIGKWPEGEETIKDDPEIAYDYAHDVIKGRWPEGEEAIKSNPERTYQYARNIIKGRWPEGEEAIKKSGIKSYQYARDIIKGRWPEGEEAISKSPMAAYGYARDIIKGRWPEGEEAIKDDPGAERAYNKMLRLYWQPTTA